MNIQIIVDSCCDVTDALRNVLSLSLASLKITVGEHFYEDDGTIDTGVLVADMKACRTAPTTACPSPEEYAALMSQADASLVVTLSSKLSGSYNAACVGRDLALEESPEKKIHVFDSESASAGETRIALLLRDMIDGGMGFEEIVEKATAFIANMKTHFVLEDLGNLVKNGRISRTAGFVGTMLNLRPIMGENGHGEIIPLEKVRGTANAMRRLVELVAEETDHLPAASKLLVLSHCNCQERAMQLKKAFLERCAVFKDVIVVPTGGLSTVYANDGGIVIAF
ncbi:DegV family protein [Ruthenibacterium sp. CLA-JM-H11]|uniref:DegV family protein n=1 Tax=Ruthenibacterium intestinale TaxID=3133163 RepID=A0ABV1GI76_9FIRM